MSNQGIAGGLALATETVKKHAANIDQKLAVSGRRSAIDGRTTRHPGYAAGQQIRKRVEEIFGWMKRLVASAGRATAAWQDRAGRVAGGDHSQPGPPEAPGAQAGGAPCCGVSGMVGQTLHGAPGLVRNAGCQAPLAS